MRFADRRKSVIFFIVFGSCLIAAALALNIGWIVLNWRQVALLVLGAVFFFLIILGLVLNTIFLVREIRRNEQHDGFINAVTHELKTPLASIRLYLETLKAREVSASQQQEFYDVMLTDCDRLLRTVDQVLRAGRDRRRHSLSTQPVDLSGIVDGAVELARARHQLSPEALEFIRPVGSNGVPDFSVLGDAEELRAAVSNLLDNAVKYSPDDLRVRVELRSDGKHNVALRIADHGIGIPNAELKRVFRRFYRVPGRSSTRVSGTGLGLFIVRAIVRRHRGRVFAESAGSGQGATFTIQLPRAESP